MGQPKSVLVIGGLFNPYNEWMARGAAAAIAHGTGARTHYINSYYSLNSIRAITRTNEFDAVFALNMLRPSFLRGNKNIRWFSWIQDYHPAAKMKYFERDGDVVFTFGPPNALGMTIPAHIATAPLCCGIFPEEISNRHALHTPELDMSIVGFIPHHREVHYDVHNKRLSRENLKIEIKSRLKSIALTSKLRRRTDNPRYPQFRREAQLIARALFQPFRGAYDAEEIYEAVLNAAKADGFSTSLFIERLAAILLNRVIVDTTTTATHLNPIHQEANWYAREYPRYVERILLAEAMLDVSKNVAFYGNNWNLYPVSKDYAKGPISLNESIKVFQKTKVNVCNNNHGVSVHSRLLLSMASGGFVVSHRSPYDDMAQTGLTACFEPDVHFGTYQYETLREDLKYWVNNNAARRTIVAKARDEVLKNHTWAKRGEYIQSVITKI
jgi:hypothetical protein